MSFWIIAVPGLIAAIVWLLRPLFRTPATAARRASFDMQVYRDQLAEVDADLTRGVLGEGEAQASRTEVSRRLLAAAAEEEREAAISSAPKRASQGLAVGLAVLVLVVSGGLYLRIGSPGYSDRPLALRAVEDAKARANRPSQSEAEALVPAGVDPDADPRLIELVAQLEDALKSRTDDVQGQALLADNLGRIGRFADAHAALGEVIRLKGDDATASDHAQRAEYMILAASGYVSPQAEAALTTALTADRTNVLGRYYSGIALAQGNRPDLALRLWEGLLLEGPEDAPWMALIREQIGEMAARAGKPLPEVARLPGPSADDMEAAAQMSPEERQVMIRGMVEQLSARLATQGGPAVEWARLIRALGVLGETARASAIWNEAQTDFANDPAAMSLLRSAAVDAGVSN